MTKCKRCGNDFLKSNGKVYCSSVCRGTNGLNRIRTETVNCMRCGNEFTFTGRRLKKCCSVRCAKQMSALMAALSKRAKSQHKKSLKAKEKWKRSLSLERYKKSPIPKILEKLSRLNSVFIHFNSRDPWIYAIQSRIGGHRNRVRTVKKKQIDRAKGLVDRVQSEMDRLRNKVKRIERSDPWIYKLSNKMSNHRKRDTRKHLERP